jgi:DnaJ-domain-containing protein 1
MALYREHVGHALQLAARKHPRRIAVHQNAQQQRRVIGSRSLDHSYCDHEHERIRPFW